MKSIILGLLTLFATSSQAMQCSYQLPAHAVFFSNPFLLKLQVSSPLKTVRIYDWSLNSGKGAWLVYLADTPPVIKGEMSPGIYRYSVELFSPRKIKKDSTETQLGWYTVLVETEETKGFASECGPNQSIALKDGFSDACTFHAKKMVVAPGEEIHFGFNDVYVTLVSKEIGGPITTFQKGTVSKRHIYDPATSRFVDISYSKDIILKAPRVAGEYIYYAYATTGATGHYCTGPRQGENLAPTYVIVHVAKPQNNVK